MGGRGFESRQKRPKLKDENYSILGDASFSHKKSIPDQKGARSSASISRVCPGRVGADPGTHLCLVLNLSSYVRGLFLANKSKLFAGGHWWCISFR